MSIKMVCKYVSGKGERRGLMGVTDLRGKDERPAQRHADNTKDSPSGIDWKDGCGKGRRKTRTVNQRQTSAERKIEISAPDSVSARSS